MKKILLLGGLISSTLYFSQKSTELNFHTPMPPEAYQFKKRLVNNVSLYTGQPNITIPLYTINLDGLEIPLSISYNSGGITTDEDATFIGLGWMLNIGGEISRTNHGAVDENFLMQTSYNADMLGIGSLKNVTVNNNASLGYYQAFCTSSISTQIQNLINFYNSAYNSSDPLSPYESFDSRPDEFFYNFGGHSGKFMYSQKNTKLITIPFDDIKPAYNIISNQNGGSKRLEFDFTLPTGHTIKFNGAGMRTLYKFSSGRYLDQSWQINQITAPSGKTIDYSYTPISYMLCTNPVPSHSYVLGPNSYLADTSVSCNEVNNNDKIPNEINFSEGKIIFTYNQREDMMPGSKRLEKIEIKDRNNHVTKTIKFNQDYFIANWDLAYSSNNQDMNNTLNKRLKLNSVEIIDGTSTQSNDKKVYKFDYNNFGSIPSKTTSKRDHWGFYNKGSFGESNNIIHFNPKTKQIDTVYTQTFSLKNIIFPEGSKKEFIYESHRAIPHPRILKYYDDISDDRYLTKASGLTLSGYNLNNYSIPPANFQHNSYPPDNKVFIGQEFEITDNNVSVGINENNLTINSNLPFQVPDYQNISSTYNFIAFELQKKDINGVFKFYKYFGTISRTENSSGEIKQNIKINTGEADAINNGVYRFITIVFQPILQNLSNVDFYHYTSINLSYRKKEKEDVKIGGLRIKEINTYTNVLDIVPSYKTKYEYKDENGKSSGKAMNAPSYYELVNTVTASVLVDGIQKPSRYILGKKTTTDPVFPLYKTSGSNVGYTRVARQDINLANNEIIKEVGFFTFQDPQYSDISSYALSKSYEPRDWQRGKPLKTQYFKNNKIIKEEIYSYNGESIENEQDEVDEINTDLVDYTEFHCSNDEKTSKHLDFINSYVPAFEPFINQTSNPLPVEIPLNIYNPTGHIANTFIPYFKIYSGFDRVKSKITTDYFPDNSIVTTKETFSYYNDIYRQLEKQNTIFADNSSVEKSFKYANHKNNQKLINVNMIGIPLETSVVKKQNASDAGKTISKTETRYDNPAHLFPTSVLSYDLQNTASTEVTYDQYDNKGNLQQYTAKDGISTVIIWGYNQTQPIAKVTGAKLSDIQQSIINSIVSASDTDASTVSGNDESALLSVLDNFRKDPSMANFQVSTYTYDPLIGVRSITPPSGIREVYLYDAANRLKEIREGSQTGKLLKEFRYNYKN